MQTCQDCGKQYEKWLPEKAIENDRCIPCNEAAWAEWEKEEAENLATVNDLEKQGHSRHCACRQVWGDGECECDLYAKGYDPYKWAKDAITTGSRKGEDALAAECEASQSGPKASPKY